MIGKPSPESLTDVRLMQAVMGVSVVAIQNIADEWKVVYDENAPRINANTPMAFSGPVAGSPYLENAAGNEPRGTINNCGSGPTPRGTYLTCEKNFNGYFGANDAGFNDNRTPAQERYGFTSGGFGYGWHVFDPRFDLSNDDFANEQNRFGWIVEIDPNDGSQKPVKRTALGRMKHEAVAIAISDSGRVAAYMGGDQHGDYCYKYVSDQPWKQSIAKGESPLDNGVLYVARFNDDFTGDWLELSMNNPLLAGKFADQTDLLVNTRIAADIVGATKMDRPEWATIGQNKSVFWTLTNNNRKDDGQGEVNAANPEFEIPTAISSKPSTATIPSASPLAGKFSFSPPRHAIRRMSLPIRTPLMPIPSGASSSAPMAASLTGFKTSSWSSIRQRPIRRRAACWLACQAMQSPAGPIRPTSGRPSPISSIRAMARQRRPASRRRPMASRSRATPRWSSPGKTLA